MQRKLLSVSLSMLLVPSLPGLVPEAKAAALCVSQSGSTWYNLGPPLSGTLHGVKVTLQTARSNGAARAIVLPGTGYHYQSGDIISIDRSIRELPYKNPKGNYWKTHEIQSRGGWDYCESTLHSSNSIRTGPISGINHAVRVCLRRSGALQCTNDWYVDIDG